MKTNDLYNKSKQDLEKIKLIEEIKQTKISPFVKPGFIGLIGVLATLTLGIIQTTKYLDGEKQNQIEIHRATIDSLVAIQNTNLLLQKEFELATINMRIETEKKRSENIKTEQLREYSISQNKNRELQALNKKNSHSNEQLKAKNSDLLLKNKNAEAELITLLANRKELNHEIAKHKQQLQINSILSLLHNKLKYQILEIYDFQTSTKIKAHKEEVRNEVEARLGPILHSLDEAFTALNTARFTDDFNIIKTQINNWLGDKKSIRRIHPFYNLNRIKSINKKIDTLAETIKKELENDNGSILVNTK